MTIKSILRWFPWLSKKQAKSFVKTVKQKKLKFKKCKVTAEDLDEWAKRLPGQDK
jgi:hypothetical protein